MYNCDNGLNKTEKTSLDFLFLNTSITLNVPFFKTNHVIFSDCNQAIWIAKHTQVVKLH